MTTPAAKPDVTAALARALQAVALRADVRAASLADILASAGTDPADIAAIEAHMAAHPPGS